MLCFIVHYCVPLTFKANPGVAEETCNAYEEEEEKDEVEMVVQPSIKGFASLLCECSEKGCGLRLHAHLCRSGLEAHCLLGNCLMFMLAELGSMHCAQQVFDSLPHKSSRSWNSLITGYFKCGKLQDGLFLYGKMKEDGNLNPSDHCYVALLKACEKLRDMERCYDIHGEISRLGLPERNLIVGCTLVDMYAKYGLLAKAQQVFDMLPTRNVVTWTALITGYIDHGHAKEALIFFEQMHFEGISPNAVTFVCSLRACSDLDDPAKGQEVHADIERHGLLGDIAVGNAVIDMYAKCGLLDVAQHLFNKLPSRDIISWTALIAGYVEHGHADEALKYFKAMQLEGVYPDAIVYICILKACGSIKAIEKGKTIHFEVVRRGLLQENPFVGNALVDMYAKCGLLQSAQRVFDTLPVRNAVSWNSLIAGYAELGYGKEVLELYEQMQQAGVFPVAATFVSCLKVCSTSRAVERGQELHAEIERRGLLERESIVGNSLIDFYGKCGAVFRAQEVFDNLLVRNLASWNALISGYVEHGHGVVGLEFFKQMQVEGMSPDSITYICILKACGNVGATEKGREVHSEVARLGLLERDTAIGNILVDMYAKCGLLLAAQQVFHKLSVRNVVSWNTLIMAHVEHGHGEEALECLDMMLLEGLSPDAITFVCSLNACGSTGALQKGRELHSEIERRGLVGEDEVGNSLIYMYAKCGSLVNAQQVFDKFAGKSVVSWNVLIAGYAEHGHGEDALTCLEKMKLMGVSPNAVTLVCSLKACVEVGAMGKAGELHAEVERQGLLERDLVVGNTLVNMYAKCGWLALAQQVFDKLPFRNVVSETALMAGYAQLGESNKVFHIFDGMLGKGLKPDPITFIVVFNACSRTGLSVSCQTYFEAMSKDYGIFPMMEHHGCFVDLLARAGELNQAFAVVKKMPFAPNVVVWQMLLNACTNSGQVELGRIAFGHAVLIGRNRMPKE